MKKKIMLEEDGIFTGKHFRFISGRLNKLWLIPASKKSWEINPATMFYYEQ